MTEMEIEKAPGWDWVAIYQDGDEPVETMSIFGCMTIEKATEEAHYSLDTSHFTGIDADYQIFAVIRSDHYDRMGGKAA